MNAHLTIQSPLSGSIVVQIRNEEDLRKFAAFVRVAMQETIAPVISVETPRRALPAVKKKGLRNCIQCKRDRGFRCFEPKANICKDCQAKSDNQGDSDITQAARYIKKMGGGADVVARAMDIFQISSQDAETANGLARNGAT